MASGEALAKSAPATTRATSPALRFDFGSTSFVEEGYVAVTSRTAFTDDRGYGWIDPIGLTVRDEGLPDALQRDCVLGTKPARFRIAGIPAGRYLLSVHAGNVRSAKVATRVMVVGCEAALPVLVASENELTTLTMSVDVVDSIELTFDSPESTWAVNAITLTPTSASRAPTTSRRELPSKPLEGRSHTLAFSTTQPGTKLGLTTWGVDTALPDPNNVRRSALYMGQDQIDVVRVSFPIRTPLVNGELPDSIADHFTSRLEMAKLAGDKPLRMLPDSDRGVHPWFKNGREVNPQRWVQLLAASQRRYGVKMYGVEPFNEADWGWGQGNAQNLAAIMDTFRATPEFDGVKLIGPSTLGTDSALPWYRTLGDRIDHGTTHALGGSFASYVNFYLNVSADGRIADNPEVHNLVEVISGAEYGLTYAIWWGAAERARGAFVNAVQGERLAYAEDRERWSSASVYRAPSGKIQAFLGSSERVGQETEYRLVSKDRPVFFDGDGPRHDVDVRVRQDNEQMIDITWGEDVQPKLGGRYVIVNRETGKVLAVADASKQNGAGIIQADYRGTPEQQWEVQPLSARFGDQSYFTIRALHSGKSLDTTDWTHEEGAAIQQWGDGDASAQHWFFDYAGDNDFFVRSRWSAKYLQPTGDVITQTASHDSAKQRWRLVPLGAQKIEFDRPAAPTGLTALAKPAAVELRWHASTDADVTLYTVLRSQQTNGAFEVIARGVTETTFVDSTAEPRQAYRYVVRAEDRCLNRSDASVAVTATATGEASVVAHYTFGAGVTDDSGNGNHATIAGSPNYEVGPTGGSAVRLYGVRDYLRLPVSLGTLHDFSFATWIQPQGGDAWQRIFDFGNDETQFLFLTPRSSTGTLRFAAKNGGAESTLEARGLPEGVWSHVVVTLNGKTARLYVNGRQAAESHDWPIAPADLRPIFNYLGKSQFSVDPLLCARLADVQIWNHAITQEQVRELSQRP
jgi:fibronectin type 3 domain-containing protein